MRYLLLICSLLLFSLAASAQLESRYVMAASFANVSSVNSTTHTATLNFQSDQLGSGFLANQVQVGFRVVTSTKRQYRISAIASTNFSSATVTLVEIGGTTQGPNGIAVVYDYQGEPDLIPVPPANATGISTAHFAIIYNHNLEVGAGQGGGISTVFTDGDIQGTGTEADPVRYTAPAPPTPVTWTTLTGKPSGFADDVDNVGLLTVATGGDLTGDGTPGNPVRYTAPADGDTDPTNEENGLSITGGALSTTRSDGSIISTVTLPSGASAFVYAKELPDGFRAKVTYMQVPIQGGGFSFPSVTGTASAGYVIAAPSTNDCYPISFELYGNSTTTNSSGELVVKLEGTFQKYYTTELYDMTNSQKVDVHLTGNIPKQVMSATAGSTTDEGFIIRGTNTFSTPNIAGNYPNGFLYILN